MMPVVTQPLFRLPLRTMRPGSGVATEACVEGGQDLTGIQAGEWSAYNNFNLGGVNAFVARVASASAGGNIEVHLDSPVGTLIGTCVVPGTGGGQAYVNAYCNITATNGTHTVYLVYSGGAGDLFSVEYFGFFTASPVLSHQLEPGNTYSLLALADGKYVAAPDSVNPLIATGLSVGPAEEFQVVDQGGGNISLLAQGDDQFVSADNDGASPLIANRASAGSWETFTEFAAGGSNIALRAMNNGRFVTAEDGGTNALIADSDSIGTWQSFTVGFVSGSAPATPNDLNATPGNSQVTLNWVASPGASGYNLQSSSNGGSYIVIGTNLAATSFTQTGLTNGTTYYYVVSATNLAGGSPNSSPVIAVPGTVNRILWVASSSTSGSDAPANALDGNLTTRWSTGGSQVPGQWFEVDMGAPNTFNRLVLNSINSANDYPRGYQVNVSADGVNWGSPVATGTGTPNLTTITFPAQSARYVRITQTGSANGTYWSIDEFNVFGTVPTVPASPVATAISSSGVNLSWNASVSANGYNVRRATLSGGPYSPIAMNLAGLELY